jgi:predicted membrane-bound spermidine synthase
MADAVAAIDRRTEAGSVYELQRRGDDFDVLVDGRMVMRSSSARIHKEIVELALAPWETRDDVTVLLAGLGMGLTLRALLDKPQIKQVDVVEHSETMVAWSGEQLAALNGGALQDRRVRVIHRELGDFLRSPESESGGRPGGWFIVVLDTDVWPVALSRPENVELYHEDGLLLLETALRPGGVLALVTARRDDGIEARLRARFQSVARVGVPTEIDGESVLYYVYRGRRSSVGGGAG